MVERTISYSIIARVNNYLSGMEQVRASTAKTVDSAVLSKKALQAQGEAFTKVGTVALGAGALAAAGLTVVVKAAAEYQAKMAQLQTLSHASAQQMQQLSDAAMNAGKAYGFSATQVADAEIELTKAGVGVRAQLGGALTGALSLAAAGQIDVGQATEIATVAMTQFGLKAKDIPHLADLLSAGADKALGSVGDLGEALKNGGLQAHNMGLSVDDTVGTLAAFANQGIIGAEAGTQLRSMFIQLQRPSKQAKDVLDQYGISLNDSSGKFVGITALAGELHDKLGGLTQAQRNSALATVFGSHAIVGATALYQYGAKGIASWISQVNDTGFASAQAAGKLNSLQGDVQKLSAAFQTDLIKAGSGADDALRGVVQNGTRALKVFGDLPGPVQNAAVSATVLTAGVGLLGGGFLVAVPKVIAFKTALNQVGLTAKGTLGVVGKVGGALAAFTILTGLEQAAGEAGTATTKQITAASSSLQDHLKNVDTLFKGNFFEGSGIKSAFDDELNGIAASNKGLSAIGIAAGDLYRTNEGQFAAIGSQLSGLAKIDYSRTTQGFRLLVGQVGAAGDQAKQLKLVNLLGPGYTQSLDGIAKGIGVAATQTNRLAIAAGTGEVGQKALAYETDLAAAAASKQATSIAQLQGNAASATTSVQSLANTIKGFGSTTLDAHAAQRAFQQAVADATATVGKNKRTLDISTQAGRDNQAALEGIASAAVAAASAVETQTGDSKKAAQVVAAGRSAFVKQAEALGETRTQAERYADKLGLIPKNVRTALHLSGASAVVTAVQQIQGNLNSLVNGRYVVNVGFAQSGSVNNVLPAGVRADQRKAAGGAIYGSGPKGVDSVRAVLAPGEHVLTARDVDAMGGQSNVYSFRTALHMAAGGAVPKRGQVMDRARAEVQAALTVAAAKKAAAVSRSAISEATSAITAATKAKAADTKDLAAAKRKLTVDTKAAAAADKAYQQASDAAAKISGKGTAKAKHAAELHARELKRADQAAKKTVDVQQKTVDAISKKLDTATQTVTDQTSRRTQLRQDREDFVSTQRRATADNPIDPLSYVDQLRAMSRDSNYSTADQKKFDKAANDYEAQLVSLATKSAAAAKTLSDLKDASDQMRTSIQSAIAGGYQASNAAAVQTASGWMNRDGIQYQTYTSGVSASSLDSYYQSGATDTGTFASQLKALAGRGVNGSLLAEIAGYGVTQGSPIAGALLSASDGQIASINSNYAAIQGNAATAGSTVADSNYKDLIDAAQTVADGVAKQIADDSDKLRKIIAQAFGLKGYASGTFAATPGLHPVAENGMELVSSPGLRMFQGGERVWTASQTQAYIRGTNPTVTSSAGQVVVKAPIVKMPDTITVQDASGFTATMQIIADQRIAADQMQDSVLMLGGAA